MTSDKIASLTDFEYRLWTGLILCADDKGRFDARPAVVRGWVFPLREEITSRQVGQTLQALADKGCIRFYRVGGKAFLYFPNWEAHQRIRNVREKYPAPEEAEEEGETAPQTGAVRETAPQPVPVREAMPQPDPIREASPLSAALCCDTAPKHDADSETPAQPDGTSAPLPCSAAVCRELPQAAADCRGLRPESESESELESESESEDDDPPTPLGACGGTQQPSFESESEFERPTAPLAGTGGEGQSVVLVVRREGENVSVFSGEEGEDHHAPGDDHALGDSHASGGSHASGDSCASGDSHASWGSPALEAYRARAASRGWEDAREREAYYAQVAAYTRELFRAPVDSPDPASQAPEAVRARGQPLLAG